MASNNPHLSRTKVLGSEDLLGLILLRVGSSKEMIMCSRVSPHWRAVTKGEAFRRCFAQLHPSAHVGFLVEMQQGAGTITKLMYGDDGGKTATAIRQWIRASVLAKDIVFSSSKGLILTLRGRQGYFTSFPAQQPRVYKPVAPVIPKVPIYPGQQIVNFGQFGLVKNAGNEGMAFFLKGDCPAFVLGYDGVRFCSSDPVVVHLCVYDTALGWQRNVSEPIEAEEPALFHSNPYTMVVGKRMYLMYVVPFIICFDIISNTFSQIQLPDELKENVKSWFDYTVASHRAGGLVLVHYSKGRLYSWVLSFIDDEVNWTRETMVDLIEGFGSRISGLTWQCVLLREEFRIVSDHFYTLQVRAASSEARFVLVTLGFDLGMFEVDMFLSTVREIHNASRSGLLGRMFALSEKWPANA